MKDKTKLENVKREKGKLKEKNNTKIEKNSTKNLSKKICILIIIFLIFVIAFAIISMYIGKDKQKLSKVKLASATDGITTSTTDIDTSNWGTAPEMSDEIEFVDGKIRLKGIIESRSSSTTLNIKFYISSDYCIKSVKCNNQTFTNTKVYENNNINTTSIEDDLSNQTSWMNIEVSFSCTYNNVFKEGLNATIYMASGEVINITIPKDYLHMYNTPPTPPKIVVSNTSKQIMIYEKIKITCEGETDAEHDKMKYEWQEKTNDDSEWKKGTSETSTYNGNSTYSAGKHTIRVRTKDEWGAYSDWSTPYIFDVSGSIENESVLGYAKIINNSSNMVEIAANNVKYSADCITYNGDLVLDGTSTIDGVSLSNKIYEVGDESDCATSSQYAKNMVILKVIGDLTIDNGVTLTACKNSSGYGGPKGLLIYCTGKLTNNGTITMTKRGAKAEGQNVYLWKNASGDYEYVPAVGGTGGGGTYANNVGWVSGNTGSNGTKRGTAGGGAGAAYDTSDGPSATSGSGSTGTSYSGGTGGGLASTSWWPSSRGKNGSGNGGAGGSPCGNGNPASSGGINGTGGLLIIYSKDFYNNGKIESNGNPGGATWQGGGSGGGSINIFYANNYEAESTSFTATGGNGGTGSISCGKIVDGSYVSKYTNY